MLTTGLPWWLRGKESTCLGRRLCAGEYAGDTSSMPGSGRSPGEGNGNPLQYPRLGNARGRGAWQAPVHSVSKSQIWLSHWTTKQLIIIHFLWTCIYDIVIITIMIMINNYIFLPHFILPSLSMFIFMLQYDLSYFSFIVWINSWVQNTWQLFYLLYL